MRASPRAWLAWELLRTPMWSSITSKSSRLGRGTPGKRRREPPERRMRSICWVAGLGSKIAERTDRFRYSQPMAHGGVDCEVTCKSRTDTVMDHLKSCWAKPAKLWSFPAATAGEVALKDIASQRPTSGLYSATAKPARSTKQPECTLFNVCENDFQILVRQSGRARWHGVIYICMQAESGITTSRADYLLVDGTPDVSELKPPSKRRTT